MKQRKKKMQSGSKAKKGVSSKIEHTTAPTPSTASLKAYRKGIDEMTQDIKKRVLELCSGNLLSAKMALMGAAREVEVMLKERRET